MAKKAYEESNIAAIAAKIREKTGGSKTYKPAEMSSGIDEVFEAGGVNSEVLKAFIDRSIKEVEIPQGVTEIGNFAFALCKSITKLTIPSSVVSIGSQSFNSAGSIYGIDEVIIPDSVTSIGSNAFIWSGVKKFVISKNVNKIEANVFEGCSKCEVYDFTRHESVPTLANINAFNRMNEKAKIYVPASLYNEWIVATNWAEYADYIVGVRAAGDPSEGLEMILSDDGSHYQVAGMGTCTDTDVVIPSEHNGLPVTAFYNGLEHQDFDGVFTDKIIVTLTVPDTITDFDKHCAVYNCTSLKELNLGSGCALEEWSIPGWFTIMGNSALERITVSEENPYLYADESGKHLFTKSNSLLISLDGSIPEGTVTICDYVFENGNPTTDGTVKIPASVTSLYNLWGDVMDFSEHTQVPTLNKPWGNAPQIIVPAALYGEWINATNWCEHADKITPA
jgi:hypothetical protein